MMLVVQDIFTSAVEVNKFFGGYNMNDKERRIFSVSFDLDTSLDINEYELEELIREAIKNYIPDTYVDSYTDIHESIVVPIKLPWEDKNE